MVLETRKNPAEHLGDYAITGGPGRPKGHKNKSTLFREALLEVFFEEDGKEKFREFMKQEFPKGLDKIISTLPKEKEDDGPTTNNYFTVINFESTRKDDTSSRVSNLDTPMATRDL